MTNACLPLLNRAWRQETSRRIRATCRSTRFHHLLTPYPTPEIRAHAIATALQQVLGGVVCGVYGFTMGNLHAPSIWRTTVLRLDHGTYADETGLCFERELRQRGVRRHTPECYVTTTIQPLPPLPENLRVTGDAITHILRETFKETLCQTSVE